MNLWEMQKGKKVKIILIDGEEISGKAYQYTSELDNEPDGACIYIDSYEILESDIAKIEVL